MYTLFTYHVIALGASRAKDRISRVLAACHRFRLQTSDIFPVAVLADRMERRFLGVGARNEFNSTALRNWLRSHSSGKFLIVCPAPSGEFARSRRGDGHRSLPAAWPPVFMSTGHNRGIPSVPGSFSDPHPAGPLMVMVITGPNCEQWNYEISKFAATVLGIYSCLFPFAALRPLAREIGKKRVNLTTLGASKFAFTSKILLDGN